MPIPERLSAVHHDSSALYVSNPLPALNEQITLRLRAPADAEIARVYIRIAPDGEQAFTPMLKVAASASHLQYWEGPFKVANPKTHYRFKIILASGEAYYLSANGLNRFDHPDWFDFKIVADLHIPDWLEGAVFYQIFPDRFFNGDPSLTPKPGEWTIGQHSVSNPAWDALPQAWKDTGNLDFYGGDLPGIAQKLNYLQDLGVNALYLTPIFVSTSNHRYDVTDFYHIDPHLGGDDGLAALRAALDAKQFRLVLDITLNHCGFKNHWFTDAQADLNSPTAEFFTFYENDPQKYEAWLNVRTLPKLNYRSQKLREAMWMGKDAIMRRWLREPYRIDGWRLDVANMQGKQGAVQLGHKIGRELRRAVKGENPNAYIYGEHFFDGTPHLQGDEIDASMNYAGFTFPLWHWLSGQEQGFEWRPLTVDTSQLPAEDMAAAWTIYRAAIPWVVQTMQFTLLDSHDTVRVAHKVHEDRALVKLAALFQMCFPGVPCVYYGDEVGISGSVDPDNRRTMPWDESKWDADLRAHYKQIIHLRRTQPALLHGGFQQLYARDSVASFLRESAEQRLVVVGHRGPGTLEALSLPVWQAGIPDGARLKDLIGGAEYTTEYGYIALANLPHGAGLILEVIG